MDMKEEQQPEYHPLELFLPERARLLMLGSFPPQKKRWSMDFYYPNLQNDMWRVFGYIFFANKNYFLEPDNKKFNKERICEFLFEKGIALGDTAMSVVRLQDNASDKFLEVVDPLDLSSVLKKLPFCTAIVTTGQKATETLLKMIDTSVPKVGGYSEFIWQDREMRLYRMPSTSRAYPRPIEEKARFYEQMFKELGLL